MSKLKVDEIKITNSNVTLVPKGTGLVKVKGAGGDDGTLKLSSGTNGVKIKSPAHSAGQSYTMILPDNNIEAGKFLKVKSVSGSPANEAVGQLEFANIPTYSLTNLDAAYLTSGTVPSARFPSTGFAAKGGGLKLVSKQTVGSTAVSSITFTGLEDDTMYKMVAKHIQSDDTTSIAMEWLDSNGNAQNDIRYEYYYYHSSNTNRQASRLGQNIFEIRTAITGTRHSFVADFSNIPANNWMVLTLYRKGAVGGKFEAFASFDDDEDDLRIHGIKIIPYNANRNFIEGTEILLYKYIET